MIWKKSKIVIFLIFQLDQSENSVPFCQICKTGNSESKSIFHQKQKKKILISIFHCQRLILIFYFFSFSLNNQINFPYREKRLSYDLFVLPIFFCDCFNAAQASVNSCIRFMNLRSILGNDFYYQLIPSKQFRCQVL